MNGNPTLVLLAGDLGTPSNMLRTWLTERGCECRFAASFGDACKSLSQAEFDLVLCQYDLPDRTAFPLMDWLEGTRSTMLFCAGSGRDGRWLPVVERGKRCLDQRLLRTFDLPRTLTHILRADGTRSSVDEVDPIQGSGKEGPEFTKADQFSFANQ